MRHALPVGLFLALLLPPAAVRAQPGGAPPEGRYVPLPFDGDLEKILTDQLHRARDLEDLLDYLTNVKVKGRPLLPPEQVKKLAGDEAGRERLKKQVEQVLRGGPAEAGLQQELRNKLQNALEKRRKSEEAATGVTGERGRAADVPAPPPDARPPNERKLAQWFKDLMRDAEGTQFGELIRDSPAWQQAMLDLRRAVRQQAEGRGIDLERLVGGWKLPDLKLDLKGIDRVRNVSLPHFNVRLPGLGGWGGRGLRAPAVPGVSVPGVSLALVWGLLAVVLAVVAWRLLARARRGGGDLPSGWQLGPWPLDPAQVATRAELVRAFEYLSLLRLGPEARACNHRALARRLAQGEGPEQRTAAERLADLYEGSRYAPGPEPLGPDEVAAARRGLCLLAGVAAA